MFTRLLPRTSRRLPQKQKRRDSRLLLEHLETRLTPSVVPTGYPVTTGTPLQKVTFSESEVLRFVQVANTPGVGRTLQVYYNDEHALALGVSKVTVNGVTTDYTSNTSTYPGTPPPGGLSPVKTGAPYYTPAQLGDDPATVTPLNLAIHEGTKAPAGAPGSSDASGRPLFPSLFVTDITSDPNARGGDWQQGGTPIKPSAIFGSWKYFTETITNTAVTLTAAADPAKNNWSLGAGSDVPSVGFAALKNEGYGAELRWNISDLGLQEGHAYRFYVQDHDGDQNKTGGDSGEAAFNFGNPALPTTANNVEVSGTAKLTDSATLTGSVNPTGTVTFYLFAPGVTPLADLSNNVYKDVVTLTGAANPTVSTATGTNPGGYDPTTGGTYQWVVVYSGDASNDSATSPFLDEPAVAADASIALSPLTKTNEVNQHHIVTALVKATPAGGGSLAPASGAPVVFTVSGATGGIQYFDSNADGDNNPLTATTDANGQATLEFTKDVAGTVTVNASATFSVLGLTVTRDTDPGTAPVAGPGGTGPASKTFVDASISLNPPSATNEVNVHHTVTANVKKNEGTGGGLVNAANAPVTFTVTGATGNLTYFDANLDGDNNPLTAKTDSSGNALLVFTSTAAGSVTVNASATLTVGGVSLTRDTDPTTAPTAGPGGTGPATKTFVDGNITLSPLTATNVLNQHHIVTATVKQDPGTGLVAAPNAMVTFAVTGATGGIQYFDSNADGDNNPLTAKTDVNGQANLEFTSSSTGSVTVNASATFSVGGVSLTRDTDPNTAPTAGPGGTGAATKFFEDLTTVVANPTVQIGSGIPLKDTATLAGANSPTGTITFKLYAPDDGPGGNTTNAVDTETVTVNGNGNYTTPTGFLPKVSASVPNPAGVWHWEVSYSGDGTPVGSKNPAIAIESNPDDEAVTVNFAPTTIDTTASAPVVAGSGAKLNDTAKLNGAGINPTGTITFTLTAPDGVTVVYTDVVTLTGASAFPVTVSTTTITGASNPGGYAPPSVGTYQWSAVYSGDGNNDESQSAAGSEPVTTILPECVLPHGEMLPCGLSPATAVELRPGSDLRLAQAGSSGCDSGPARQHRSRSTDSTST